MEEIILEPRFATTMTVEIIQVTIMEEEPLIMDLVTHQVVEMHLVVAMHQVVVMHQVVEMLQVEVKFVTKIIPQEDPPVVGVIMALEVVIMEVL